MTMSVIGATTRQLYPQSTNPARVAGSGFAQSLAVATGPETRSGASSGATTAVGTPVADTKLDYTHMTPHQLYAASKELLKAGKITMDEGFHMQWMSGEFATHGASNGDETPVDYVAAFKDTRAFNAIHGGKSANGYDVYTGILNAIGAGEQNGQRNDA